MPELRNTIPWAAGLLHLMDTPPFDSAQPRFCAGRECKRNTLPQVRTLWDVKLTVGGCPFCRWPFFSLSPWS